MKPKQTPAPSHATGWARTQWRQLVAYCRRSRSSPSDVATRSRFDEISASSRAISSSSVPSTSWATVISDMRGPLGNDHRRESPLHAVGELGAGPLEEARPPERRERPEDPDARDDELQRRHGPEGDRVAPARAEPGGERRHRERVADDERRQEQREPREPLERMAQIGRDLEARETNLRRDQVHEIFRRIPRHRAQRGTLPGRARRCGVRAQAPASSWACDASACSTPSVAPRALRNRSLRSSRSPWPDFGAKSSAAPAPTSRPTPKMPTALSRRSELVGLLASPSAERMSSLLRSLMSLSFMGASPGLGCVMRIG